MSTRRQRSSPEWATFAACCLVLLVLVGMIVVQLRTPERPAAPVATISVAQPDGGRYRVEAVVRNEGDVTAANVQVVAELTIEEKAATGDQTIDFLSGGEEQEVVFYFRDDPGRGELTVEVAGFTVP